MTKIYGYIDSDKQPHLIQTIHEVFHQWQVIDTAPVLVVMKVIIHKVTFNDFLLY